MAEREFVVKEWRDDKGILHIKEVGQELIRCKECKWYRIGGYSGIYVCHKGLWDVTENSFCSYGEREDE